MSPFCGKIVTEHTTETRSKIGSFSKDKGGNFSYQKASETLHQLAVQDEKHTHKALSTKAGFISCSVFCLIHGSPLSTQQANKLGFHIWQKDPPGEVGIQNDERMRW